MRAFTMFATAGALASALLSIAASISPADARISLAQCRSSELACKRACILSLNGMPATQGTVYGLSQCLNKCWDNHAACVDFSMNNAAKAKLAADPPPNFTPVPKAGLLETSAGFAPQAPAPTGTPVQPAAPPPAPPGPSFL